MQAGLGTIVCKFGGDPVMFVVEEAISVKSQMCPYHVTFDFDLDLEHSWARPRGAQLTAGYTVNTYSKPPLYYTLGAVAPLLPHGGRALPL